MSLYIRLLKASLRARLQYKWDFALMTIIQAWITALDFLMMVAILQRFHRVGGWNINEVALLTGVSNIAWGLFRTFGSELDVFQTYLVSGEFDSILIRPWPTLLTLIARRFDTGRIGGLLQGCLVTLLGLRGVLAAGAPRWLSFYIWTLPIAGAFIMMAISLATCAAGFWLIRIEELQIFTTNAPLTAANYPIHIFPGWMRRMLTSLFPVACMGYLPLSFALGKGGSVAALAIPFVAALLSMLVALALWHIGVRHYQSTGS